MSTCYLARYPFNPAANELDEEIILRGSYGECIERFEQLAKARQPSDPMLQVWYTSRWQVECMAATDQPFAMD